MLEIVSTRHNPLIDPSLHVWGWEIPVYLFLGGLGGRDHGPLRLAPLRRAAQAPAPRLRARFERASRRASCLLEPRHARALPRPRAQALRLAAVRHVRALVAHVLGGLDPALVYPVLIAAASSSTRPGVLRSRPGLAGAVAAAGATTVLLRRRSAVASMVDGDRARHLHGHPALAPSARGRSGRARSSAPLFLVSGLSSGAAFAHWASPEPRGEASSWPGRQRCSCVVELGLIGTVPDRPRLLDRGPRPGRGAAPGRTLHRRLLGGRGGAGYRPAAHDPVARRHPPHRPHADRADPGHARRARPCGS